eukprot:TRINITY_DN4294_c0_g1_i1.p1 TRINITY_DN4294_c0_g1~~TRINITY_DN4294_c0_g1_i1.p1  ORF type:complete len:4122 (-),score=1041.10 TRINITY_DN4294_c0_g1_i1:4065-15551(-)
MEEATTKVKVAQLAETVLTAWASVARGAKKLDKLETLMDCYQAAWDRERAKSPAQTVVVAWKYYSQERAAGRQGGVVLDKALLQWSRGDAMLVLFQTMQAWIKQSRRRVSERKLFQVRNGLVRLSEATSAEILLSVALASWSAVRHRLSRQRQLRLAFAHHVELKVEMAVFKSWSQAVALHRTVLGLAAQGQSVLKRTVSGLDKEASLLLLGKVVGLWQSEAVAKRRYLRGMHWALDDKVHVLGVVLEHWKTAASLQASGKQMDNLQEQASARTLKTARRAVRKLAAGADARILETHLRAWSYICALGSLWTRASHNVQQVMRRVVAAERTQLLALGFTSWSRLRLRTTVVATMCRAGSKLISHSAETLMSTTFHAWCQHRERQKDAAAQQSHGEESKKTLARSKAQTEFLAERLLMSRTCQAVRVGFEIWRRIVQVRRRQDRVLDTSLRRWLGAAAVTTVVRAWMDAVIVARVEKAAATYSASAIQAMSGCANRAAALTGRKALRAWLHEVTGSRAAGEHRLLLSSSLLRWGDGILEASLQTTMRAWQGFCREKRREVSSNGQLRRALARWQTEATAFLLYTVFQAWCRERREGKQPAAEDEGELLATPRQQVEAVQEQHATALAMALRKRDGASNLVMLAFVLQAWGAQALKSRHAAKTEARTAGFDKAMVAGLLRGNGSLVQGVWNSWRHEAEGAKVLRHARNVFNKSVLRFGDDSDRRLLQNVLLAWAHEGHERSLDKHYASMVTKTLCQWDAESDCFHVQAVFQAWCEEWRKRVADKKSQELLARSVQSWDREAGQHLLLLAISAWSKRQRKAKALMRHYCLTLLLDDEDWQEILRIVVRTWTLYTLGSKQAKDVRHEQKLLDGTMLYWSRQDAADLLRTAYEAWRVEHSWSGAAKREACLIDRSLASWSRQVHAGWRQQAFLAWRHAHREQAGVAKASLSQSQTSREQNAFLGRILSSWDGSEHRAAAAWAFQAWRNFRRRREDAKARLLLKARTISAVSARMALAAWCGQARQDREDRRHTESSKRFASALDGSLRLWASDISTMQVADVFHAWAFLSALFGAEHRTRILMDRALQRWAVQAEASLRQMLFATWAGAAAEARVKAESGQALSSALGRSCASLADSTLLTHVWRCWAQQTERGKARVALEAMEATMKEVKAAEQQTLKEVGFKWAAEADNRQLSVVLHAWSSASLRGRHASVLSSREEAFAKAAASDDRLLEAAAQRWLSDAETAFLCRVLLAWLSEVRADKHADVLARHRDDRNKATTSRDRLLAVSTTRWVSDAQCSITLSVFHGWYRCSLQEKHIRVFAATEQAAGKAKSSQEKILDAACQRWASDSVCAVSCSVLRAWAALVAREKNALATVQRQKQFTEAKLEQDKLLEVACRRWASDSGSAMAFSVLHAWWSVVRSDKHAAAIAAREQVFNQALEEARAGDTKVLEAACMQWTSAAETALALSVLHAWLHAVRNDKHAAASADRERAFGQTLAKTQTADEKVLEAACMHWASAADAAMMMSVLHAWLNAVTSDKHVAASEQREQAFSQAMKNAQTTDDKILHAACMEWGVASQTILMLTVLHAWLDTARSDKYAAASARRENAFSQALAKTRTADEKILAGACEQWASAADAAIMLSVLHAWLRVVLGEKSAVAIDDREQACRQAMTNAKSTDDVLQAACTRLAATTQDGMMLAVFHGWMKIVLCDKHVAAAAEREEAFSQAMTKARATDDKILQAACMRWASASEAVLTLTVLHRWLKAALREKHNAVATEKENAFSEAVTKAGTTDKILEVACLRWSDASDVGIMLAVLHGWLKTVLCDKHVAATAAKESAFSQAMTKAKTTDEQILQGACMQWGSTAELGMLLTVLHGWLKVLLCDKHAATTAERESISQALAKTQTVDDKILEGACMQLASASEGAMMMSVLHGWLKAVLRDKHVAAVAAEENTFSQALAKSQAVDDKVLEGACSKLASTTDAAMMMSVLHGWFKAVLSEKHVATAEEKHVFRQALEKTRAVDDKILEGACMRMTSTTEAATMMSVLYGWLKATLLEKHNAAAEQKDAFSQALEKTRAVDYKILEGTCMRMAAIADTVTMMSVLHGWLKVVLGDKHVAAAGQKDAFSQALEKTRAVDDKILEGACMQMASVTEATLKMSVLHGWMKTVLCDKHVAAAAEQQNAFSQALEKSKKVDDKILEGACLQLASTTDVAMLMAVLHGWLKAVLCDKHVAAAAKQENTFSQALARTQTVDDKILEGACMQLASTTDAAMMMSVLHGWLRAVLYDKHAAASTQQQSAFDQALVKSQTVDGKILEGACMQLASTTEAAMMLLVLHGWLKAILCDKHEATAAEKENAFNQALSKTKTVDDKMLEGACMQLASTTEAAMLLSVLHGWLRAVLCDKHADAVAEQQQAFSKALAKTQSVGDKILEGACMQMESATDAAMMMSVLHGWLNEVRCDKHAATIAAKERAFGQAMKQSQTVDGKVLEAVCGQWACAGEQSMMLTVFHAWSKTVLSDKHIAAAALRENTFGEALKTAQAADRKVLAVACMQWATASDASMLMSVLHSWQHVVVCDKHASTTVQRKEAFDEAMKKSQTADGKVLEAACMQWACASDSSLMLLVLHAWLTAALCDKHAAATVRQKDAFEEAVRKVQSADGKVLESACARWASTSDAAMMMTVLHSWWNALLVDKHVAVAAQRRKALDEATRKDKVLEAACVQWTSTADAALIMSVLHAWLHAMLCGKHATSIARREDGFAEAMAQAKAVDEQILEAACVRWAAASDATMMLTVLHAWQSAVVGDKNAAASAEREQVFGQTIAKTQSADKKILEAACLQWSVASESAVMLWVLHTWLNTVLSDKHAATTAQREESFSQAIMNVKASSEKVLEAACGQWTSCAQSSMLLAVFHAWLNAALGAKHAEAIAARVKASTQALAETQTAGSRVLEAACGCWASATEHSMMLAVLRNWWNATICDKHVAAIASKDEALSKARVARKAILETACARLASLSTAGLMASVMHLWSSIVSCEKQTAVLAIKDSAIVKAQTARGAALQAACTRWVSLSDSALLSTVLQLWEKAVLGDKHAVAIGDKESAIDKAHLARGTLLEAACARWASLDNSAVLSSVLHVWWNTLLCDKHAAAIAEREEAFGQAMNQAVTEAQTATEKVAVAASRQGASLSDYTLMMSVLHTWRTTALQARHVAGTASLDQNFKEALARSNMAHSRVLGVACRLWMEDADSAVMLAVLNAWHSEASQARQDLADARREGLLFKERNSNENILEATFLKLAAQQVDADLAVVLHLWLNHVTNEKQSRATSSHEMALLEARQARSRLVEATCRHLALDSDHALLSFVLTIWHGEVERDSYASVLGRQQEEKDQAQLKAKMVLEQTCSRWASDSSDAVATEVLRAWLSCVQLEKHAQALADGSKRFEQAELVSERRLEVALKGWMADSDDRMLMSVLRAWLSCVQDEKHAQTLADGSKKFEQAELVSKRRLEVALKGWTADSDDGILMSVLRAWLSCVRSGREARAGVGRRQQEIRTGRSGQQATAGSGPQGLDGRQRRWHAHVGASCLARCRRASEASARTGQPRRSIAEGKAGARSRAGRGLPVVELRRRPCCDGHRIARLAQRSCTAEAYCSVGSERRDRTAGREGPRAAAGNNMPSLGIRQRVRHSGHGVTGVVPQREAAEAGREARRARQHAAEGDIVARQAPRCGLHSLVGRVAERSALGGTSHLDRPCGGGEACQGFGWRRRHFEEGTGKPRRPAEWRPHIAVQVVGQAVHQRMGGLGLPVLGQRKQQSPRGGRQRDQPSQAPHCRGQGCDLAGGS